MVYELSLFMLMQVDSPTESKLRPHGPIASTPLIPTLPPPLKCLQPVSDPNWIFFYWTLLFSWPINIFGEVVISISNFSSWFQFQIFCWFLLCSWFQFPIFCSGILIFHGERIFQRKFYTGGNLLEFPYNICLCLAFSLPTQYHVYRC